MNIYVVEKFMVVIMLVLCFVIVFFEGFDL